MKLSEAQRRILEDAVRYGKTRVGGRNIPAINKLREAGLITDDWRNQPSAQGFRWDIIVYPTDAGTELVKSEQEQREVAEQAHRKRYEEAVAYGKTVVLTPVE